MPMHEEAESLDPRFAELFMMLPPDWSFGPSDLSEEKTMWPVDALRYLARFPHENCVRLAYSHSIPNGDPPAALAEGVDFTGWVLTRPVLPPPAFQHLNVGEGLIIEFLAVLPIYQEEMELKINQGMQALESLLTLHHVTELLNIGRVNVALSSQNAIDTELHDVLPAEVCRIEFTAIIDQLLQVAPAERNERWRQTFLQHISVASMTLTDPPYVTGPDGFPYLVLTLPRPDEAFQAYSLTTVLPQLLEHGCGIVVGAHANSPDWVFSYGALSAFAQSGEFFPNPAPCGQAALHAGPGISVETILKQREIVTGNPSESRLPRHLRKHLAKFLETYAKISTPGVILITDTKVIPNQSLSFNFFVEDFSEQEIADLAHRLSWFLPSDLGLTLARRSQFDATEFFNLYEA